MALQGRSGYAIAYEGPCENSHQTCRSKRSTLQVLLYCLGGDWGRAERCLSSEFTPAAGYSSHKEAVNSAVFTAMTDIL